MTRLCLPDDRNTHVPGLFPLIVGRARCTVSRLFRKTQRHYSLIYQMTRITRERGALVHDDRLDALAMAVAYWTDRMSVDSDKQKAQWEKRGSSR